MWYIFFNQTSNSNIIELTMKEIRILCYSPAHNKHFVLKLNELSFFLLILDFATFFYVNYYR